MSFAPTSLSAGKEVVCYCTKCRMDLMHIIIAMKGDRIVRVQCKTCRGDHAYRASKGLNDPNDAPATKRRIAGAGAPSKKVSVEDEWARLMNENRARPLKEYGADVAFAPGDRLKHPVFGEGVATKAIYPNKVEIVFSMDVKVLIHAGAAR